LTKNLAKSCYFDFYVPITPKPEICKRPFSLAEAEKGDWAQAACPSGLRQALTTPKSSSAGTMSILACGGEHWIALTERGGLMVRGRTAEGQLRIGTRNSEWYPTGLGGIALDSETASCTTPHVRCSPVSSSNPPRSAGASQAASSRTVPQNSVLHEVSTPLAQWRQRQQLYKWATDLDLPAFSVTVDQAAEQAAEVSSIAARLAACAATRRMPRLISRRLTARLRLARHLTFVVPLCRAATHPDQQALHRQPPQGQSRRTASCTKFLPRLRNGARGNSCINGQQIWTYQLSR